MHICKLFCNFVADLVICVLKKQFFTYLLLLWTLPLTSQVQVSVGSPNTWSVQMLAPYTGDTVEFDVPMVVCSNMNRLVVSPWRMFEPTSQGPKGSSDYVTAVHINNSCGFTLNGVGEYHRCGEKIHRLQAVVNSTSTMTFVGGKWQGNTRKELEANLPDLGDYRLLVCAFNLENYFVANMGSMGARNYEQHKAQREKISKALARINADIYGLVELEQGDDAIEEIVNDLNTNLPGRHYVFFHESSAASAFQKSDYVYDANTVEPIGIPSDIAHGHFFRWKKHEKSRQKLVGEK